MSFKSIVTFIHDLERDEDALRTAAAVTAAEDGHLTAMCLGIDRTNPGAYYAGAQAIALEQTLAIAQQDASRVERGVEQILAGSGIRYATLAITTQVGALSSVVGDGAHLQDLVVLPRPYGEGRGLEHVMCVEAALFRTRVPLLIVPDGHRGAVAPERVVVAWNESPEALAAIRGALPFLKAAQQVNIAIIDPPTHGANRSDPGGALAEMLARQDVHCDVSVLARTMPRVSDVMMRHLEDQSADMLVMGAYGHTRLREAILGGATRNMLEMSGLPVLMAH
ncbi:universal stress protein [Ovoidimarina sediminis]|uniref:universal stress protein n=1 Tax=Ovoidimarina sediminis TaxID=3079856 RepID=UPI0029112C77|nr:universal stress protein [Rhodophyticola sp. MJ-SS7]MDU8946724.1 universal stress protein [Rhodophyticola sp. MJ-SS7]